MIIILVSDADLVSTLQQRKLLYKESLWSDKHVQITSLIRMYSATAAAHNLSVYQYYTSLENFCEAMSHLFTV